MSSILMPGHRRARRRMLVQTFFTALVLAAALFAPFLIIDKGFFLYCGDFNSQQQPFTYSMEGLIQQGLAQGRFPTYAWSTDLGSGFAESYSFYLLGSPFFWLGCLFPQSWSPYLLAPLLCLKFAVAAAGASLWAGRYTRTLHGAQLAGILYAFSGFSIYNIFFNHFLDVVAVFPFLLWSVDEFWENDRRAIFPLTCALCLFVNYFFFVGQVVFVVLYFVLHLPERSWRADLRRFGLFCFEAVLGVGMAMILALPSFFQVMANPRVDNFASGLNLLFYWRTQQYLAIATSAFLPQDPPYLPNLFPDCSIKWTSMSLYLPLMSMAGVIAWLRTNGRRLWRRLLLVCAVMAFVPVLNSAFYAFNSSYYCRWYYMPLLVMALVTVLALESAPIRELRRGAGITAVITAVYLVFALIPDKNEEGGFQLGVEEDPLRFFLTLGIALASVLLLLWLLHHCPRRSQLLRRCTAFAAMFAVIIGIYTIACGKFPQRRGDADYKMECYDYRQELSGWLNEADPSYYRIDTWESYTNLGLWLDRSCLQFFNSTVEPSILEFYPQVGVKRDVSSKPEMKEFALRGLLNVKYLLTPSDRVTEFYDEVSYSENWLSTAVVGPYTILENEYYVPFGTTYDYYMTYEQFEKLTEHNRGLLLMRAILLDEEQIAAYSDVLEPLPDASLKVASYAGYLEDCRLRGASACSSFVTDNRGFTASITTPGEELVFFSIPYNEGWSALVNGREARVEKVDHGLMAVRVDAGENTIRFDYMPRGQRAGIALTLASLGLWALYALLCFARRRRTPVTPAGFEHPAPQPEEERTPDAGAEGPGQASPAESGHTPAGETQDGAAPQPPAGEGGETERP